MKSRKLSNPVADDISAYSMPSDSSIWLRAQSLFKPHHKKLAELSHKEEVLKLRLAGALIEMDEAFLPNDISSADAEPRRSPQAALRHLMDKSSKDEEEKS